MILDDCFIMEATIALPSSQRAGTWTNGSCGYRG